MSTAVRNENRQHRRFTSALSAVVKARENNESFWKEVTELISISRSGAGFYLKRRCEVGRLVSLMMPMPKHLRCYDEERELYRVWGLVQHCSQVSGKQTGEFHVGVAFVGRNPPQSYLDNPLYSYRIAGMNEDGTWKIVEAKTSFVVRRHPRYWASLEVNLDGEDENRNPVKDEKAMTENISQSGAAVLSKLEVNIGDSVNFECPAHNFSSLAVVRNRQTFDDESPKLHLEFIDASFPIENLKSSDEKMAFDDDDEE